MAAILLEPDGDAAQPSLAAGGPVPADLLSAALRAPARCNRQRAGVPARRRADGLYAGHAGDDGHVWRGVRGLWADRRPRRGRDRAAAGDAGEPAGAAAWARAARHPDAGGAIGTDAAGGLAAGPARR